MGPGNLVLKARPAMAGDDEATVSEAMIVMSRELHSLQGLSGVQLKLRRI